MDTMISIAQLATLLTAAGVAIYVLGLIGLAVSVYRTFAETWATAWYAVSLMPRTVVAGQGVRIWRRSWVLAVMPLVFFLLGVAIISVTDWFLKTFFIGVFSGSLLDAASSLLPAIFLVLVAIVVSIVVRALNRLQRKSPDGRSEPNPVRNRLPPGVVIPSWIIGLGLSLLGGFIVATNISGANWNNITVGFLLFLVGSLFTAITAARGLEQPLPMVLLEARETSLEEGQPYTVGWLIAHSDGYWHLFNNRHVLVSVPDARVTEARVADPRIPALLQSSATNKEKGSD